MVPENVIYWLFKLQNNQVIQNNKLKWIKKDLSWAVSEVFVLKTRPPTGPYQP